MIPPIGSISAALQAGGLGGASGVGAGATGASTPSAGASALEGALPAAGGGEVAVSPAGEGGFGEALSSAISSLEQTQQSATGAAQSLATGTASDPESAVVSIDEAQLAMQLASQIRTKATEAAQQIFQTQV